MIKITVKLEDPILFKLIKQYRAINIPAKVIGIPEKEPSNSVILYLASLYAPAIGNINTNK
ncbi:hypothetical protein CBO05C_0315 [Clostridium botulinum B str. Osaka05]|uniref:Uncharacterized protein n=1 Tax=Clostridium botulinum B str. Osaka05 TaxID=1407017 RepID=A0A0S6TY28_CLOBO|nr:hypothetical protein CBO05C_0315 [Clostridium botulinum B str. Osaka05]